jgi:hypothetical protein
MEHLTTIMLSLDLYHVPARVHLARKAPLPDGIETLLRIAGNEGAVVHQASRAAGVPPGIVHDAAVFFIEQAMLFPEADAYRVLGARPGAPSSKLRRNMSLLLRWLHPDHGRDEHAVFAHRVTEAWGALKSDDRRVAYDRTLRRQGNGKSLTRKKGRNGSSRSGRNAKPSRRPSSVDTPTSGLFRRVLLLLLGRAVY